MARGRELLEHLPPGDSKNKAYLTYLWGGAKAVLAPNTCTSLTSVMAAELRQRPRELRHLSAHTSIINTLHQPSGPTTSPRPGLLIIDVR